jgi:hypothetical protein
MSMQTTDVTNVENDSTTHEKYRFENPTIGKIITDEEEKIIKHVMEKVKKVYFSHGDDIIIKMDFRDMKLNYINCNLKVVK